MSVRLPSAELPTVADVQRRTLRVLVGSLILGGVGIGAGISVGALLAEQVSGSDQLSGLALTSQVLGAAVIAIPMARLAARRGRRIGLSVGYLSAAFGAILAITAAELRWFPLLLIGMVLLGASSAASLQARYAAIDLALPKDRGRSLGIVVWVNTVGAVLGPNLTGPGGDLGSALGLPRLAGPLVICAVLLVLSATWSFLALRPDPLLTARVVAGSINTAPASVRKSFGALKRHPAALTGIGAMALAHTLMVSVMVMTPIHIHHGTHGWRGSLTVVGLVISIHVFGMYGLSPVSGWLVDRINAERVVLLGVVLFAFAFALAGPTQAGGSPALAAGLLFLGLGWSCCLVAGSALISEAVPLEERPTIQGLSDLIMGLVAAAGGALAGVIVGATSFSVLNIVAASVLAVGVAALFAGRIRVAQTA